MLKERIIESGDQRSFYKDLKGTVGMRERGIKKSITPRAKMVYFCGMKDNFEVGGYGFSRPC